MTSFSKAERKMLNSMLDQLHEEFSNAGCNDFDLREYMPKLAERNAFVAECIELLSQDHDFEEEVRVPVKPKDDLGGDYRLPDYIVLDGLREKLDTLLNSRPITERKLKFQWRQEKNVGSLGWTYWLYLAGTVVGRCWPETVCVCHGKEDYDHDGDPDDDEWSPTKYKPTGKWVTLAYNDDLVRPDTMTEAKRLVEDAVTKRIKSFFED